MANNFDFNKLDKVKKVNLLNVKGWVTPLVIEYGIYLYSNLPSYHWRVAGTTHTFIISVKEIDHLSKGNYVKHFTEVLENFREDYKSWAGEYNFGADWMQEYRGQYGKFISI